MRHPAESQRGLSSAVGPKARPGRRRSTARTRLAAVAAATAAAAIGLVAAVPANAGTSVPVVASFAATGSATIDQTYVNDSGDCTVDTHDVISLNWRSQFDTTVEDGRPQGAQGTLADGPGSLSVTESAQGPIGCGIRGLPCTASLGAAPASPPPVLAVSGADRIHLEAQSLTGRPLASGCDTVGAAQIAGRDLSVLADSLPDSTSAALNVPGSTSFLDFSQPVGSGSAPGRIASSCLGVGHPATGNTACSATLSWSGTLTLSRRCHKAGESGSGASAPNCIEDKTKKEAARAAKQYEHETKEAKLNYTVQCTGPIGALTKGDRGGKWYCLSLSAKFIYLSSQAARYQQIAKDPPDSNYTKVAKPHPPHAKGLSSLRRPVSGTYKLMQRYLKIAGLVGAVTTAQNRASAAYQALSEGNLAAAAALDQQDRAELAYAKRAALMLRGQHRFTRPAAAELRHLASTLRGSRSKRLAKAIRKFAGGLASKRAAKLDKRSAAVLAGIGA